MSDTSAVPSANLKYTKLTISAGSVRNVGEQFKLAKCPKNTLAKVKVEDNQRKIHFVTMFTNVILSIIKTEEGNTSRKLLQTSQMLFTIDNRDIITRGSNQEPSSEHTRESDVSATIGKDENHSKTQSS